MKFVDYYKLLGVERDASPEEISKAYKKLARKYHPDLNKSPNAEARFKEINEAHEVLKDPEKRKRYDLLGANWKHGVPFEPPPGVRYEFHGTPGASGFSDFFESIFGGLGGGGGGRRGGLNLDELFGRSFGGAGRAGFDAEPAGGQDIESTLTIQLEDTFHGSKKSIELSGPAGPRRYEVKIPRGVRDGERIRLAGQGQAGPRPGDLLLLIRVAPHPLFRVEGDDLTTTVDVPAWDAALGCKLEVPTLEGRVTLTVPPGCSSGQRLRLRGKGLPRRGGGSGDLHAELRLVVPKELTPEQEELFRKLRGT